MYIFTNFTTSLLTSRFKSVQARRPIGSVQPADYDRVQLLKQQQQQKNYVYKATSR